MADSYLDNVLAVTAPISAELIKAIGLRESWNEQSYTNLREGWNTWCVNYSGSHEVSSYFCTIVCAEYSIARIYCATYDNQGS